MNDINSLATWAGIHPVVIVLMVLWSLVWKGLGLWKAANLRQKKWFIALLVINMLGILEIIYLFFVAKKYKVEIVEENQ